MTVAVLGSINMDVIAYLPRLPKPGETLHGPEYRLGLGGDRKSTRLNSSH